MAEQLDHPIALERNTSDQDRFRRLHTPATALQQRSAELTGLRAQLQNAGLKRIRFDLIQKGTAMAPPRGTTTAVEQRETIFRMADRKR